MFASVLKIMKEVEVVSDLLIQCGSGRTAFLRELLTVPFHISGIKSEVQMQTVSSKKN